MSYNENSGLYEGYIYCITNSINNKKYIGQTTLTTKLRWSEHKHAAGKKKSKTALYLAMRKYGIENFHIQELEKIESITQQELRDILNTKEIDYIKQYKSLTHETGYNITPGGNNISEQQKETTYCFDINNGELFKIFNSRAEAGNYFNIRSSSISNAIREKRTCKGYYFTNVNIFDYVAPRPPKMSSVPIKQYEDGILIHTYKSCADAASKLHLDKSNIYGVCTGMHQSAGGYIWRFENDEYDKYPVVFNNVKAVNKYSKDDVYIETYNSILEASNDVGVASSNISAVLAKRKNCKTAGGYKWFYTTDTTQPDKSRIDMDLIQKNQKSKAS